MRQTHEAGDKLFVDYAGQTAPIVDASTGEIPQAQIFVAVQGALNDTHTCAADWVGQHHWSSSAVYCASWCPISRVP